MTYSSQASIPHPADISVPGEHKASDLPPGLQATLQRIVDDVVAGLSCVGAMVATLEANNTLPVRAYAVDIAPSLVKQLEERLGTSFIGPKSVAYLDDKKFKDNLGVRAVKGNNGHPEKFIISDRLYDLFRPVVNKPLSFLAQRATGIKQVIAVPFFLEDEVVGNLFAAARTEFSPQDIDFLIAFGRQAATAIQSQRRLAEAQALESIIFDLQASLTDENRAFKVITDAVVEKLGYLFAAVAPRIGNMLPVRAYTVNANMVTQDFIDTWQRRLGFEILGEKAVAYLDRVDYAEQLSVRAIKSGQAQISDSLYDLVRPVIPKLPTMTIQKLLGIKQVISIPFFLEGEAIGNLYVVSQRPRFSVREQEVLKAFGQHAAISLRNALLYRKSENLRETAQIFAKIAFSSAANVHTLRNHIGAFKVFWQIIKPELGENFRILGEDITGRLTQAANILDHLHEPWRQQPDSQTDVSQCLQRAINNIVPNQQILKAKENISLYLSLTENLPPVYTSLDMLTEAFRVLLKNAIEAIRERIRENDRHSGGLWIESRAGHGKTVEVLIRDNGIGIKPESLDRIFELRWSTKDIGMGFGLFWTKDYIEGLGGDIKVESVWQEGTSFCIHLPTSTHQ